MSFFSLASRASACTRGRGERFVRFGGVRFSGTEHESVSSDEGRASNLHIRVSSMQACVDLMLPRSSCFPGRGVLVRLEL